MHRNATPERDTIFAVASGTVRGAVTMLRISGPRSASTLRQLGGTLPPPRLAALRRLRDADGQLLDVAMVLWLPGPGSYTGEDSVELHLHGGRAVADGVTAALLQAGLRPAEAGEFTRRAFLGGRIDLLAAEGIADLVAAETEAQRRQALAQMGGGLGRLAEGWSARLRTVLAQQEALIDFPDEDLPPEVEAALQGELAALAQALRRHLHQAPAAERLREGLVFVVAGPPNVGKSSLVNALLGRELAIVARHPGTTRDALEARLELGGVPVTLVDTAGLRATNDPVEAEGIRRARHHVAAADLVLQIRECGDAADAATAEAVAKDGLCPGSVRTEPGDAARLGCRPAERLAIASKADLGPAPPGWLAVSVRTGAGLDALRQHLVEAARRLTATDGEPLTRERHRAAVGEAARRLDAALAATLPELRAEELRLALRALGRLTGVVGTEDILDTIFGQFCIGK